MNYNGHTHENICSIAKCIMYLFLLMLDFRTCPMPAKNAVRLTPVASTARASKNRRSTCSSAPKDAMVFIPAIDSLAIEPALSQAWA
jgi:hypothetical protein